jgi:hypothetical protein
MGVEGVVRKEVPEKLERGRILTGRFAGQTFWGFYGAFVVMGPSGRMLRIIGSGEDDDDEVAAGWEHVSVSLGDSTRPPNWAEMCFVKDLFWDEEETVIQFHPPRSTYVNYHPSTLHLWKHKQHVVPLPPALLIGPVGGPRGTR